MNDRREFLGGVTAALVAAATRARAEAPTLPAQVAGVTLPRTDLTNAAVALARRACPDFLFNHCMRTYLFGVLALRAQQVSFDPQLGFVAATLHDLGLLPAFASPRGSFEIDGANRAEALLHDAGRPAAQGRLVWNAIVMHDMRDEYAVHQSGEAQLVGNGAGADVISPEGLDPKAVSEVLLAFPRLQFKTRFTELLVDHCKRKPTAQIGWLDGLCRETVPDAKRGSVERSIAVAPYTD